MKVLAIALASGVQWRLMFEAGSQAWNDAKNKIADHGAEGRTQISIADDFGQAISFWLDEGVSFLTQDMADVDRLEVTMMIRQERNKQTAMQQLQADPRNIIMPHGGGLMS